MPEPINCGYCGEPIDDPHYNQKYHKDCWPHVEREQTRERVRRYRKRWADVLDKDVGTGNIKEHRNPDFDKEQKIVESEMRRLKIQRNKCR